MTRALHRAGAGAPRSQEEIAIRPLKTQAELAEGVAIQRETWGETFTEVVPASILQISQKVGGLAVGAFNSAGRLVGFLFGLTGTLDGRLVHWSHMLAVRPEARGAQLGQRLKLYQRDELLRLGVTEVRWTFDPLVAQNAHLNLNRLGADVERYVPEMYGSDTGSDLHSGLGTDRFVVLWRIGASEVQQIIDGKPRVPAETFERAPVVNSAPSAKGGPQPVDGDLPLFPALLIEVPADIQQVKLEAPDVAPRWRETTRRAFLWYLERGYRVAGFRRDPASGRCAYLVTRRSPSHS